MTGDMVTGDDDYVEMVAVGRWWLWGDGDCGEMVAVGGW